MFYVLTVWQVLEWNPLKENGMTNIYGAYLTGPPNPPSGLEGPDEPAASADPRL